MPKSGLRVLGGEVCPGVSAGTLQHTEEKYCPNLYYLNIGAFKILNISFRG